MRKLTEERGNHQYSLLEQYLLNKELDTKDVIGMAADMLLAGIDTVYFSSLKISILR